MNAPRILRLLFAGSLAATLADAPSRASDHADPMSLTNPFEVQEAPEANITDLHAFVVDDKGMPLPAINPDGTPVAAVDPFDDKHRLVISLCVRRALRPNQTAMLDLKPYTFRVHLDLAPPVRFAKETTTEGKVGAEREAIYKERSMQALYGGIITHPEDIVESAVLEFELSLANPDGQPYVRLDQARAWGLLGPAELKILVGEEQPKDEEIGVTAAVFEDPFIFPRFFRRNVVGVVTSIPLSKLMPTPDPGPVPILLWATTHEKGRQIDHVGRSLRTQLPRFGHLNDDRPADHVREITRVHAEPTVMEALLASFAPPLLAHRHYDTVPDVMVYDLRKPARFPNGRWLEDDVAKTLADAGETLLFELAYAESKEVPRASTNDKSFRSKTSPDAPFPYLAERWTKEEIDEAAKSSTVPFAPDPSAVAQPTLDNSV
jgi:hypothetical protein